MGIRLSILPGPGRGTIRRMVEGACPGPQPRVVAMAPTTTFQAVPLPVPGRI